MWIRVAGNATKIKANHPQGWRCFIEGVSGEIPLRKWSISGQVTPQNAISQTRSAGDKHGLVAWIDFFGTYVIKDDFLEISLEVPTTPPPSE